MLTEVEVKSFTLGALSQVLAELADTFQPPCLCHLFDDQTGASPGRIASFELDTKGNLLWWNWRTEGVCSGAAWPLKLRVEFEDDRIVVWLRGQRWDVEPYARVRRGRHVHA